MPTTTTLAPSENRLFYPALDGLRAIALLMVFFAHYIELPWGWTGVEIFFVLSGFLITGILFDTRHDPHSLRNFYMRRALRIFPLYYGVLLAVLLCWPVFHWQFEWKYLLWPAYLGNYLRFLGPILPHTPLERLADLQVVGHLHTQPVRLIMGHFWSLCVEEQFYLVWPWVVLSVRSRRALVWICAVSVPFCLIARIASEHLLPHWLLANDVLQRATPLHFDALLVGGLIALLLRGPWRQTLLRCSAPALALGACSALMGIARTPAMHLFAHPYPYPAHLFTFPLTLIDILAAVLVLALLQPGFWLSRFLSLRPLRWMGRISYGAYVFHDIPHALYARLAAAVLPAHATIATAGIALAGTLGLAALSYHFFESPFLRLKYRFGPARKAPASTSVQTVENSQIQRTETLPG